MKNTVSGATAWMVGLALLGAGTAVGLVFFSADGESHVQVDPDAARVRAEGVFAVHVETDGEWREVAAIPYNRHYRAGRCEIASSGDEVRVRLEKRGGGRAHIDMAALDGEAPSSASGAELGLVTKLDNDVADATEPVEFTFEGEGGRAVLELVARIEAERLREVPFGYPAGNTFRPMTERSSFYEYEPGSRRGRLALDGEIVEEELGEPFFEVFTPVGSGHPQAATWGWVMDDGADLYVALDFASDNTLDGEADYAKVYAKAASGLKEFKISESEREWGLAGFSPTERAAYRHKTYEFRIPIEEVRGDDDEPLLLAFAAYGTSAPFNYGRGLAHSAISNRYLAGYLHDDAGYKVKGKVFNYAGAVVTPQFEIHGTCQNAASAVADGTGGFLVVFDTGNTSAYPVKGVLLDSAGQTRLAAGGVTIFDISDSTNMVLNPAVAYDHVNDQFLVAWEDGRDSGIWARLVEADGTLVGSASFLISNFAISYRPFVAYNSDDQECLVTWGEPGATAALAGQRVSKDGALVGGRVEYAASATLSTHDDSMDYDEVADRYLVVFRDSTTMRALLVNRDGTADGTAFDVEVSSYSASVDCLPLDGRHLMAFDASGPVRGRYVAAGGTPDGATFDVVATGTPDYPTVAANRYLRNFGVGYYDSTGDTVEMVVIGEPTWPPGNDDDGGCAAGGTSALVLVLPLGALVFLRRRHGTARA